MIRTHRIHLAAAVLACLAGAALVGAQQRAQPQAATDLNLDSAVNLYDDGNGSTAWITQGGDGTLCLVSGSDANGYTYRYVDSNAVPACQQVQTAAPAGTWGQDTDGNPVFAPQQQKEPGKFPNVPAQPLVPPGNNPVPPPPKPPAFPLVIWLPNGPQITITRNPDGSYTIDISNRDGSGVKVTVSPKNNPPRKACGC